MQSYTNEYRTGRTAPKKNRRGIIAVLLILVIFFAGVISALGLLNIHLFWQTDANNSKTSLSFSGADAPLSLPADAEQTLELEGMQLQELPTLYQKMYNLPAGLYVCYVDADSHAAQQGIVVGDVVTRFGNTSVTQIRTLQALIQKQKPGDRVHITAYRNGRLNPVTLILGGNE